MKHLQEIPKIANFEKQLNIMRAGDKVRFLNDTGGGVIIRFLDPETVLVKIEEDFEVPVKLGELIPDRSKDTDVYHDKKNQNNTPAGEMAENDGMNSLLEREMSKKENISEQNNSGQVYLAFTHEVKPNNLKIHLINDSDYNIYYIIGSRKMDQHLHQYAGLLEANTKVVLGNLRLTKTDEPTIYSVQYLGYKNGYYQPFMPVDSLVEIDTRSLAEKQYDRENDFFDLPAALFALETRDLSEEQESRAKRMKLAGKEFITEKIRGKSYGQLGSSLETSDAMEVDLHIHEIVEDTSGLSEGEMLDIQLRRFEMALETAINGKVKKVIFIHGVGQGKLKYEITKILIKKYPDLKHQDASFKEYGYGATMVLL